MKLLITAGGTREPIDRVRSLANTSTGATGAALAAELAARGHSVELLLSKYATAAVPPHANLSLGPSFTTTADLETQLRARLGTGAFDAVIMAAAVADYRPKPSSAQGGKIDSDSDALTLRLVRVPKLLPQLRQFSPRPLCLIGFKLTVGAGGREGREEREGEAARRAAVQKQFASSAVDAVVHNDFSEIEAARAEAQHSANGAEARPTNKLATSSTPHPFRFFTRADESPPVLANAAALAQRLDQFLRARAPQR
ncbi:hypothetical protein AXK11_01295 [Cephaloticoccus primus]|uniref:DNA/pantothenate metabolism flavoprotein C-terminal domain-containing protein n=1 Tax=Cephaloticoccus primus TaxID=1548207 RepID=A0A139SUH1_9BACT|nr:phosphopantothenoylcysteine decarboxylase [Cephaloticoccus primus]KXU38101.1 hypothetical protein AXK11_01295 [Cephaloticoccus primus]